MRALVAAGLAVFLVFLAGAPHVHHPGSERTDHCAVCVARDADAARSESPDVAPAVVLTEDAGAAPGLPPVCGAPLGAVPGQSPPRNA